MKSAFVVTYAAQIVRSLHQLTFWLIKVNINETREARILKKLETGDD